MVHGQPDYGMYNLAQTIHRLADMGELAVRLGSINQFDRRGEQVWTDNFEAPVLKWTPNLLAGGNLPALSNVDFWMGQGSVLFQSNAAGSSILMRDFPLIRTGKIGVEFWVKLAILTPGYFQIHLLISDGTNESSAYLRLDNQAQTAQINTNLGWVTVSTRFSANPPIYIWTPVKIVANTDTDMYERLIIGSHEIDLTAHTLFTGGVTANEYLRVNFTMLDTAAGAISTYMDNFILTQNEP